MKNNGLLIFTIGFTHKSAETFFGLLKKNAVGTIVDIRISNGSQLAGFSKGGDLEYFLDVICGCSYRHDTLFAPTMELMKSYRKHKITPARFEADYRQLMEERGAVDYFNQHYAAATNICLLCSEESPEHCHRRVLAEMLAEGRSDRTIIHL